VNSIVLDAPRLRASTLPHDSTNTLEFLDPEFVGRITELRSRVEDLSTDLTALLEAIGSPNGEVKRQVCLCLRDAVDHVERVSEKLEAAENAAAGTFEPKD